MVQKYLSKLRILIKGGGRKYIVNSGWILLEHFLRAVVGIAVGVYVGRYLGPEQFGILNYIIVLVTLVLVVSKLGLDGLLVREFIDRQNHSQLIAGTSFWMMSLLAVVFGISGVAILGAFEQKSELILFFSIALIGVVLQSFSVIDWYYQARVASGVVVKCRVAAIVIATILKVLAIYFDVGLISFFIIYTLEYMFLALFYLYVARQDGLISRFFYVFSFAEAKVLLRESWPLLISSLAVILYTRIDQVMIRAMLGDYHVGVYSAALKFFDAWAAVPYLISVSLLPAIRRAKDLKHEEYLNRLVIFFRALFWSSVVISFLLSAFSYQVIYYTYGSEYSDSAKVLGVVMLSSAWGALGNCTSRYLIVEKMGGKIAVRIILAAILNIILNYILIPRFGILGAAYGTLISSFFANYVFDFFDNDLRDLRLIKNKAILFIGNSNF